MNIDLVCLLLTSLRALSVLQLFNYSLLSLVKYELKQDENPPNKLLKE